MCYNGRDEKPRGGLEGNYGYQNEYKIHAGRQICDSDFVRFATKRGEEIGYDNVFDYSLGNPSVPVPEEFTECMIEMLKNSDPCSLHGYSPSLGNTVCEGGYCRFPERKIRYELWPGAYFYGIWCSRSACPCLQGIVTKPGDEIPTFCPYFPEYNPYVNLTGAVLKVVPPDTESFQINF